VELDLQRFYNLNRRVLMWIAFFAILYLLRDFFALMFMTFIFAFVMRKVARFVTYATRAPYWAAVVVPYGILLSLLVLLMVTAIPKLVDEGREFSVQLPDKLEGLAEEIRQAAAERGLEPVLAKYLQTDDPVTIGGLSPATAEAIPTTGLATQPTVKPITNEAIIDKIEELLFSFLPEKPGRGRNENLGRLLRDFAVGVAEGTFSFLLAIVLSFLIVLDFDKVRRELRVWQQSPVGRFFHEASRSVVNFSEVVGTAFQCQLMVAALNTVITAVGLVLLGIKPLLLLTTIVFIFGLIPVLGVWISSVPIVLIAFNDYGWQRAVLAVVLITVVHLLEAYVFNPRIYAARFHLNPVIVLIILLVGHKLFGVWGMLLGIPVTYYVLNIAQVPPLPRKARVRKGSPAPPEAKF